MMDECVTTIGLCKRYGSETCVDHLALKVPQGAVYGFLGPNGAGKTTTLKMLLGLVHPSAGSVRLLGHELTPRTRLAILREVGSLIESPSYYGHLTARENLEIVRRLRGLPAEEIDEALRTVRLDGQVKKPVNHFSLGMKQRLGIAAALMGRPRLLLLDEPTAGMDALSRRQMWNLLRQLNEKGLTILLTTHYIEEAQALCDRVALMDGGKLEDLDTPENLICKLGAYAVDEMHPDGVHSSYFAERSQAIAYLSELTGNCTLRDTTLEDVFVEQAGKHLTKGI